MRAADVIVFLRTMEHAIVAALAEEGIAAARARPRGPAYTGVWVGERKIASIGVHLSRGVTAHGFAINVDNDVEPFHQVTACGLPDVRMTSVALETGRAGAFAVRAQARRRTPTRRPTGCASASSRPARSEPALPVPSLA